VICWAALDSDQVSVGLFQACYTAQGLIRPGSESRVSAMPLHGRFRPVITPLPDGGWETTWMSQSRSGISWGVFQRLYDLHGVPQRLSGHLADAASDVQDAPSCTRLDGGGLVFTWTGQERAGERWTIRQRRYDGASLHRGPVESVVATSTSGPFTRPLTISLLGGKWLLVWGERTPEGAGWALFQQAYTAEGLPSLGFVGTGVSLTHPPP
jgi:hypothetical protein